MLASHFRIEGLEITMSERSAVQEPMLKYADEIGWTRVSRSQVRRLGRADVKPIGVNLRKGLACSRAIHCASYIQRKEAQ